MFEGGGVGRVGGLGRKGSTALGRIDVETCYTRGARSRDAAGGGQGGDIRGRGVRPRHKYLER